MRSDDSSGTTIFSSVHTLDLPLETGRLLVVDEPGVPLSIFSTELSALQAVVRYLRDARKQGFGEIAATLNRSPKTIWATYQSARNAQFTYAEGGLTVPLSRFASRQFSPLETVVSYLAALGFANAEIARKLSLDSRTTWTVQRRAQRKEVHR